jgi:cyanophycin synthetase
MTTTDGVYIEGRRIDTGDCSGPKSARNVLLHPGVDAAVLETARGGVLREGLGFDRCDVAVVTNIGLGDHLGLSYISTVEDLSVVKRVIVKNVTAGERRRGAQRRRSDGREDGRFVPRQRHLLRL